MKTGLVLAGFWTVVLALIAVPQWSNSTTAGTDLPGWMAPTWAIGAVALVLAGVAWDHMSSRPCPRCGHRVRNGTMRCASCRFDFGTVGQGRSSSNQ